MTIKNNNGDGQTLYVKRYMTDRWFSRIVGSLGRSYDRHHVVLITDGFELDDLTAA